MNLHILRTAPFAAIALAALALGACGGDDDKKSSDGGAQDAEVAERVETYLQQNLKSLPATKTPADEAVSSVQAVDGKVRVITFLNAGLPDDHTAAGELCRLVKASGVAEAEHATIVDAGDVDIRRC
jgi:hypothetical protein